jgi:hypothetical protein
MSHAGFEVRPVRQYDVPRYPTTCLEPEPEEPTDDRVRPRDVLRWLVAGLLMLGLLVGAIACGDRGRLAVVPPRADGGITPDGGPQPDGGLPPPDGGEPDGGDIIMGDIADCAPGDIFCADTQTLMTCNEDQGTYTATDCDAHCQATYGPQSYTLGCDVNAVDPCNCHDMLDGGIAQCTPGTVWCLDPSTVETCDQATGSMVSTDCTTWCHEQYGATSTAAGCDASQSDNPCGCTSG